MLQELTNMKLFQFCYHQEHGRPSKLYCLFC